jgi:thiol:disulfide interchange protein DsbD
MVAEATAIAPGGTATMALQLKHPEGWHSYYRNPGGIEIPPAIEWQLPRGFTAGPIQWPVPQVKEAYGSKSFIYAPSVVLLVDLTAPADAKVGETAAITAKASWQICADGCRSEDKEFTLTLPVAAASEPDPAQAELFKAARAELPQTDAPWTVTAKSPSPTADVVLRLSPKPGAAATSAPLEFIPDVKFLQPISAGGKVDKDGKDWLITLKRAFKDMTEEIIPQGDTLSGIVTGGEAGAGFAFAVPTTPITADGGSAAGGTKAEGVGFSKFLLVLGGMLLGGLILNLMPCVFPVIGLKIMGFVQQAGDDRRKIVGHGLAFTVGVLASFGVLSGTMFALNEAARRLGKEEMLNWGYQLQYPWVVLVLMLLMFVLALNMSGLFEIGASATSVGGKLQHKSGLAGSFFSGILATVVATPCSAPFLGTAIGVASGLPALQFFTAFGTMGLGLALPYLVLSAFPKLIERLPRPGAWMESFKQGMSFLLYGATGYLLWIYADQVKVDNLLGPIVGLAFVAVAAWVYGRWFLPHRGTRVRRTAVILALGFAAGGLYLAAPSEKNLQWETWSPAAVEQTLKSGRPVYIDFTAKWCATCQYNKLTAYSPEVVALMRKKRVVAFKADNTSRRPEIDTKVREYGRAAIPVNVLIVPGKDPVVTPELLTPSYLIDLFSQVP